MIVIDTSALGALYASESQRGQVEECLEQADALLLPISCMVEFAALRRFGGRRFAWMDRFVSDLDVRIVSVEAEVAGIAVEAERRYGKGSGHKAQLNFGDCLVYAVAKYRDLPLLYVGDDFRHTDITPALD